MTQPPRKSLTVSLNTLPVDLFSPPTIRVLEGTPVSLAAGRYLLRSLTPGDATPRFLTWLNSPEMLQGLNLSALNFTLEQLRRFIAGFDNRQNYLIGIFARDSGLLVGFYTIDMNLKHKVGQITTGIGEKAFEGKGALWATNDALLDHFYEHRDIEKMTARILSRNHRMIFNFVGSPTFFFEAKLKEECLAPDGKRLDILVFSSFRDAFRAFKASPQWPWGDRGTP